MLTEMAEANSQLARFVGLDAYHAAGGVSPCRPVRRTGLSATPSCFTNWLLTSSTHPAAIGTRVMGGSEPRPRSGRHLQFGRIYPEPLNVPQELVTAKEQAETELESIPSRRLDGRPTGRSLDELRKRWKPSLPTLRRQLESFVAFDPEDMQSAGLHSSIGRDGEISIEKGLVRREDLKRLTDDGDVIGRANPRACRIPLGATSNPSGCRQHRWSSPGTGWSPSTCWCLPPPVLVVNQHPSSTLDVQFRGQPHSRRPERAERRRDP